MKSRNLLMAAFVAAIFAVTAHAQTSAKASQVASAVNKHYNSLKSLRVSYVQHYQGMGMSKKESGTLLLQKPGKMRWTYSQPAGKLFILDGRFAYFYTPGQAQATRIPAKQLDDLRSPLRFLLGHTQIEKEFNNLQMTASGDGFVLAGVPKGMEKRVSQLSLKVTADGVIHSMKMEETDGAISEFSFSGEQANAPVREQDFTFAAPEGVKVIDGLPPV